MYYFIGDIHGYADKLMSLFKVLKDVITEDDTIIFLGDYIDRGRYSYEVIEYLLAISKKYSTIFLMGNHEDMLLKYLSGNDYNNIFMYNGGRTTEKSYRRNCGKFELPYAHHDFFHNLIYYYEGEDFIAVHAGLNPDIEDLEAQDRRELIWIRDKFYSAGRFWPKTVIFGHTPVKYLGAGDSVYINDRKNIIGIDSGVIFGRPLVSLRWPDRKIFESEI